MYDVYVILREDDSNALYNLGCVFRGSNEGDGLTVSVGDYLWCALCVELARL